MGVGDYLISDQGQQLVFPSGLGHGLDVPPHGHAHGVLDAGSTAELAPHGDDGAPHYGPIVKYRQK